jgi:hypothetical protein
MRETSPMRAQDRARVQTTPKGNARLQHGPPAIRQCRHRHAGRRERAGSTATDKLQVFGDVRVGAGTNGCVKNFAGTGLIGHVHLTGG